VEFISDARLIAVAGADAGEICERFLGVVGVLFEDPTWTERLFVSWSAHDLRQLWVLTYLSGYQNEITTNKSPIGIWMRLETLQATL
jgi:hypothetical protein